jgi:hypothetical protein
LHASSDARARRAPNSYPDHGTGGLEERSVFALDVRFLGVDAIT